MLYSKHWKNLQSTRCLCSVLPSRIKCRKQFTHVATTLHFKEQLRKSCFVHFPVSLKKKGMKIIDTLVQQNIDIKYFLTELLQKLHEELLIKITQDTKKSQTSLSIVDLRLLLDLLAKAYEDMKYAVLPQLPLELAL